VSNTAIRFMQSTRTDSAVRLLKHSRSSKAGPLRWQGGRNGGYYQPYETFDFLNRIPKPDFRDVNIFYTSMKKIHGNFVLFLSIKILGTTYASSVSNNTSLKNK